MEHLGIKLHFDTFVLHLSGIHIHTSRNAVEIGYVGRHHDITRTPVHVYGEIDTVKEGEVYSQVHLLVFLPSQFPVGISVRVIGGKGDVAKHDIVVGVDGGYPCIVGAYLVIARHTVAGAHLGDGQP